MQAKKRRKARRRQMRCQMQNEAMADSTNLIKVEDDEFFENASRPKYRLGHEDDVSHGHQNHDHHHHRHDLNDDIHDEIRRGEDDDDDILVGEDSDYTSYEDSQLEEFTLLGMNLEKCEWINSIISDMWPYICIHVKNVLSDQIQPMVQDMEPKSVLSSFKFTEIHLGSITPRIQHINAYRPKVQFSSQRAKHVILDLEFEWASNQELKFNCMGLPMGVNDVYFKGHCRVEMSPLLIAPPFFGSLAISFTEMPKIDFDLTGIGNLVEMPGINSIMIDTVNQIFGDMFVLPARYIVPMISEEVMSSHNLSPMDLMHPFAKGCIFVHVKYAYNLLAKDSIKALGLTVKKGKSDPYLKIELGNQEFKTRIKKATLEPTYDEKFCLLVTNPSLQTIRCGFYDDDSELPGNVDDPLGNFSIPCSKVYPRKVQGQTYHLDEIPGATGTAHVDFYWVPLKPEVDQAELNAGLVQKTVISIVVEFVYEIPQIVQEKYPTTAISIGDRSTMFLQTMEMISYEHNFLYTIDERELEPQTITFKSFNHDVIAKADLNITMFDLSKEVHEYFDIPLIYKSNSLKSKCQTQQIRCRIGVRVKRAVGDLPYENVTNISPDKYGQGRYLVSSGPVGRTLQPLKKAAVPIGATVGAAVDGINFVGEKGIAKPLTKLGGSLRLGSLKKPVGTIGKRVSTPVGTVVKTTGSGFRKRLLFPWLSKSRSKSSLGKSSTDSAIDTNFSDSNEDLSKPSKKPSKKRNKSIAQSLKSGVSKTFKRVNSLPSMC